MLSVAAIGHSQQILSLQQCREMALANNIAIRSSDNKIEQAKEQQKEAHTGYYPQVSAMGATFKSTRDMVKGKIDVSSLAELIPSELLSSLPLTSLPSSISYGMLNHGTVAGVTAIQPVYAGGQITNGNKLAQVGLEVSEIQKEQSEQEVLLTVEKYYWQIVTLKSKRKTLDKVDEMLNTLFSDAKSAFDAGVALRNDLLQVQLKQNEMAVNRNKLNNGIALCKMLLAQYIGLSEGADIDVEDEKDDMPEYPVSLKQDAEFAVMNTPEYRLLQKNVEASALQIKMEKGKNLPTVGVGASYNYNNLSGSGNNFGLVFATVSVPISSWWSNSHAINRKKLSEEHAKEQLADNTELLKIRIQKNWNDIDDAYKQLQLARRSIEQSEENLRLNRNQYKAGVSSMSDLLQAESLYQDCCDKYTEAYSQYRIKTTEYKQSVGM